MNEEYEDLTLYDEIIDPNKLNYDNLHYCIRIIYKDGNIYTDGGMSADPKGLIFFLDDGGNEPAPIFKDYDEMLSLIYERLDDYELNKKEAMKLQIFNKTTNEIIYSKKFN